jgi:urease accessory protein
MMSITAMMNTRDTLVMGALIPTSTESRLAILRLFHLVSPALPVGAYAYSQGLEYAVEAGWVNDEASTLHWLQGLSRYSLATLDLPLLLRLHRCWLRNDLTGVRTWTAWLIAARETAEVRAEERHLGAALARVLCELDVVEAHEWRDGDSSFATLFSLAASRWHIAETDALSGYLWAWTENQVLAAIKLVPLGQSAGQRLLHRLTEDMPELIALAEHLGDADMGVSVVRPMLASALHETQYSRLFRS